MVPYFGDFPVNATVYIPINTFDSNDPAASVTATNLAEGDVHIHKDGGTTQRNNAAGITMTIDYDSITGNHLLIIDTSDNTVADFYQAGHEYMVRVEGVTVDAGTINAWVGSFSIERSGGALALLKHADYGVAKLVRSTTPANALSVDANNKVAVPDTQKVDVNTVKTQAITCGAGVTIRADVGAAAAPGAANGMLIGGSNAATTFANLTVSGTSNLGAIAGSTVTFSGAVAFQSTFAVTGTTTLTGNVSLGGTLGVTGATTLASLSITGQLDAGNVLVDTTTVLTGNVTLSGTLGVGGATTLASLSVTGQLDAGNLLVDTTTVLTGNVTLSGTLGVTGATTLASLSITGQLDAGNILVDTTTVLTGNVTLSGTLGVTGATTFTGAVTLTDMVTEGSLGKYIADILDDTGTAGVKVGNDAIGADQLAATASAEIATTILGSTIETQGSITVQKALSTILSSSAGVTADGGATFKTPDGTATRIAATLNASKERTAIILTPSA